MGELGANLNKALLPVNQIAAISWIIEKFPIDTNFVIALGHKGAQVREYLSLAHPQGNFDFVEVTNFDGAGSGPGKSLLACRDLLQQPFYFVSCDTLWNGHVEFDHDRDWLAVAPVPNTETNLYCNIEIHDGNAVGLHDKCSVGGEHFKAFTGLCFILNIDSFWHGLASTELVAGEHQISNGIQTLIDSHDVGVYEIDWLDIGCEQKYRSALSIFESYDFTKKSEHLYIFGGRVLKYFEDESLALKRVQKARMKPAVFPADLHLKGNFYSYKFVSGETLYKQNDFNVFQQLLCWLDENLWHDVTVDQAYFGELCREFYFDKTMSRLDAFERKYPSFDEECLINGQMTPSARSLLELVDWDTLSNGLPSFIHGDLQFDNVIYDKKLNKFTLIDWRQDFSGQIEFGDMYYDFAKLLGGITLNYDLIKKALMDFRESATDVHFDFAQRYSAIMFETVLKDFVERKGYCFERVQLLVGIIFINMSPLHHYPFDKLLCCLGRQKIKAALENQG
jgi:hypothetical protein